MKNKYFFLKLLFILSISSNISFGQITVSISNMKYTNGGTGISDCGTINFAGNSTIQIDFYMNINSSTLSVNPPIQNNSNFRIYTKKTVSSTPIQYGPWDYPFIWSWNPLIGYYPGKATKWAASTGTTYVTLKASDFNNTDGKFYISVKDANNVEYKSCEYSIVNKIPAFSISPNTVNMPCGSTLPVKLTVNSDYDTPGTLTYNWNVGNGWNLSPGTYPTSNNSFELIPTGYSYSDVSVTPILNGVVQPTKTCTVTPSTIATNGTISGSNALCASGVYTFSGLLAGQSVSWSLSNTTAGTLSSTTGTTIILTETGGGAVNLIATISDACGQSYIKTLSLFVGSPPAFSLSYDLFENQYCDTKYHYTPFIIKIPPGASLNIQYMYPNASYGITSLGNNEYRYTFAFAKNYSGSFDFIATITNSCGTSFFDAEGGYYINSCAEIALPQSINTKVISNENYVVYPNPANETVTIELKTKENQIQKSVPIVAELFDILGQSKSKIQILNNKATLSIDELKKGIYILKIYINEKTESHQIAIE